MSPVAHRCGCFLLEREVSGWLGEFEGSGGTAQFVHATKFDDPMILQGLCAEDIRKMFKSIIPPSLVSKVEEIVEHFSRLDPSKTPSICGACCDRFISGQGDYRLELYFSC